MHLGILSLTVWLVFPASQGRGTGVREASENGTSAKIVLALSDALLAALVWLAAYELQNSMGWWPLMRWVGNPPATTMVVAGFAVAVWIGLRYLMGLYPGHALSQAQRLRRHAYSVVGALVAVSFIMAFLRRPIDSMFGFFQLVGGFPHVLLTLGFVGLLLLAPLVQDLVLRVMRRLGVWDSPVNDGPR